MRIAVQCTCGKVMQVDARFAGTTRTCIFCRKNYRVPGMDDAAMSGTILDGEHNAVVATMHQRSESRPQWSNRYWWMILTMIPLIWMTFSPEETNFLDRIKEAKKDMTEKQKAVVDKYEQAEGESGEGLSQGEVRAIMHALPDHKLPGALLTYDTTGHWIFALLSGFIFLSLTVMLFPSRTTEPQNLGYVFLFTGTAGIMLLLMFQFLAFAPIPIAPVGIFILIVFCIKLIGFSYLAAMSPEYGFFASLLGFTFGVGLCEELCKMLPVLWHYKRKSALDWRGACAWGLASGIGFGVSEGISYSSDFYNGFLSGDIYWVRFMSCVALHAVWAASAGISMWKNQDKLSGAETIYDLAFNIIAILFVPMLLHGAYDTVLKKDMEIAAVLIALLSFAWMAWTIEDAKKHEVSKDEPLQ